MNEPIPKPAITAVFTVVALIALAANSVLCRWALGDKAIDAPSFAAIRLLTGAAVLFAFFIKAPARAGSSTSGGWPAAFALFIYAVTFSFAYNTLTTGTGALILFGAVQITMIVYAMVSGNKLLPLEWAGVLVAFGGFVYLVLPGLATPSFQGAVLMTAAGIAWGAYTLYGRNSGNPAAATAANFLRCVPLAVIMIALTARGAEITLRGLMLAMISGGVTSGLGYIVWYRVLKGLTVTRAAVLQLSVPLIAAMGGVIFVSESVTTHLMISAVLILGGILVVVLARQQKLYFKSK